MTDKIPDPIKHINNLIEYLNNWVTIARMKGCDKEVINQVEGLSKKIK